MLINAVPNSFPSYEGQFFKDACDFFSCRRSGHMGIWRYSEPLFKDDPVNGMKHWAEFVEAARDGSAYYPYAEELNVIRISVQAVSDIANEQACLIDLGPGSREAVISKPGYYLKNCKNFTKYMAVDFAPEALKQAELAINEQFPNIKFSKYLMDFYKDTIPIDTNIKNAMTFFGQTMFNLPIDPMEIELPRLIMESCLRKLRKQLSNSNGILIVTQDTNQNEAKLYEAYMTEATFNLNLLWRIKRDLPVSGDFDPMYFDFEPIFMNKTGALVHSYICNRSFGFSLGNENFFLNKGQRLFMHNTYKFSASQFQQMALLAGFTIKDTIVAGAAATLHILEV